MKLSLWPRAILNALLLHIILIALSILQVFIYSMLVEPGRDQEFYSKHAEKSGPWISVIFGSLLIFFMVKRFIKRNSNGLLTYALALPLIYIALDLIMVALYSWTDLTSHLPLMVVTNGVKVLSALASYYLYRPRP